MRLYHFLTDTTGAVTVDWTVLAAATVGLGLSAAAAVQSGTGALGDDIQSSLERARVAGTAIATLSFDDVDGLTVTGWGWRAMNEYGGWTAVSDTQAFEIIRSGYAGVVSPDGRNMLDLDASPGNLGIGRTLEDLTPGATHTISFNAADVWQTNSVNVFFGGQLIGTADPNGTSMSNYSFEFVAGSGDGSDQLVLQGVGPLDNVGVYIHGVVVN
jgi:hypothetical protein